MRGRSDALAANQTPHLTQQFRGIPTVLTALHFVMGVLVVIDGHTARVVVYSMSNSSTCHRSDDQRWPVRWSSRVFRPCRRLYLSSMASSKPVGDDDDGGGAPEMMNQGNCKKSSDTAGAVGRHASRLVDSDLGKQVPIQFLGSEFLGASVSQQKFYT